MMIGKCGRVPSTPDRRSAWFGRYLDARAYDMPAPFGDWTGTSDYGWFANDRVGNCTFASLARMIQQRAALRAERSLITDDTVIRSYSAVTGFELGKPETDRGGQMLDALKHVRKHGLGPRKITAFMRVNVADPVELRAAIHCFGSVYVGMNLPQRITEQSDMWRVPYQQDALDRPGSLASHAGLLTGYDRAHFYGVPWVDPVTMTVEWVLKYVDEGYVVLDELWVSEHRLAPNGFDYQRLMHDLTAIGAAP